MNRIDLPTVHINPIRSNLIPLNSFSPESGTVGWTMPSYREPLVAFTPGFQQKQPVESMVIAQYFDQDILGDLGNAMSQFVESGQVWALLIGIVLGYLIRGLTTY